MTPQDCPFGVVMYLYCGVDAASARAAWTDGLPLSQIGTYHKLTTCYAGYFGYLAQDPHVQLKDNCWGIVEIDSGRIDNQFLLPSVTFLEQATRDARVIEALGFEHGDVDSLVGGGRRRVRWFRERIHCFAGLARRSLTHLGVGWYRGNISSDAVTRVTLFHPSDDAFFIVKSAVQPSLNIADHIGWGYEHHKLITQWLLGRTVGLHDWLLSDPTNIYTGQNYQTVAMELLPDLDRIRHILNTHPGVRCVGDRRDG